MCQVLCWQFIFITSINPSQTSETDRPSTFHWGRNCSLQSLTAWVSAPERFQAQVTWSKRPHIHNHSSYELSVMGEAQMNAWPLSTAGQEQILLTLLIKPIFRLEVNMGIDCIPCWGNQECVRRCKSWGKEHFSGDSLNPFVSLMHRHAHSSPGYLTKLISK